METSGKCFCLSLLGAEKTKPRVFRVTRLLPFASHGVGERFVDKHSGSLHLLCDIRRNGELVQFEPSSLGSDLVNTRLTYAEEYVCTSLGARLLRCAIQHGTKQRGRYYSRRRMWTGSVRNNNAS